MPKIQTVTKRGNKYPWLIYEEKLGGGEIIAMLRVPSEEFWEKLGKGLNIRFADKKGV